MYKASRLISDNTNAMNYAEKLLQICRESGERLQEYRLSKVLAEMYLSRSKYANAKRLTEKLLQISIKKLETEMGKRTVT